MARSELDRPEIWLALSDEKMAEAKDLLRLEHWRGVVSAAYFTMFYAAKAALVSVGVEVRKRSRLGPTLSEHFVKTGLLDSQYNHMLMRGMRARELGDYDPLEMITQAGAEQAVAQAEAFVAAIKVVTARSK
jgi:uncharacterized protein (UPF0332 family)